jgi:hypothetical protein
LAWASDRDADPVSLRLSAPVKERNHMELTTDGRVGCRQKTAFPLKILPWSSLMQNKTKDRRNAHRDHPEMWRMAKGKEQVEKTLAAPAEPRT